MVTLDSLPFSNKSIDPINPRLLNIVESCQFYIVCFTFPFYTFLTIIMVDAQNRKSEYLKSPFFKLCISTAIIDLVTIFTNYTGALFPKWGWGIPIYLSLDQVYMHVYFYVAWSTGISQAMCVSVLAANRLSAMIFPHKYQKMWIGKSLLIAYAVQFIPGFTMGLATFLNGTQLYRNPDDGLVAKFTIKWMTDVFFMIGGVFLSSNCLYLIASYCYLFYVLRKRHNSNLNLMSEHEKMSSTSSFAKERLRVREFKLFIMSTITVASQFCLLFVFMTNITGFLHLTSDQFHMAHNAVSDIYSGINPYLLWIFSDSLRKHTLERIGLSSRKSSQVSVISLY